MQPGAMNVHTVHDSIVLHCPLLYELVYLYIVRSQLFVRHGPTGELSEQKKQTRARLLLEPAEFWGCSHPFKLVFFKGKPREANFI